MIRDIVKDTFFLQQKSLDANRQDLFIGRDLRDTLVYHQLNCVGLAANMIGYHKRIIVIQMGVAPLVMFNPIIISKENEYHTEEGCLSLSGSRSTTRYDIIEVSFRNMEWQEKTITLRDFPAQVCQHELDHLDGILI